MLRFLASAHAAHHGLETPSLSQLCVCFCKAISRHPLIALGIDPRADHLLGMAVSCCSFFCATLYQAAALYQAGLRCAPR